MTINSNVLKCPICHNDVKIEDFKSHCENSCFVVLQSMIATKSNQGSTEDTELLIKFNKLKEKILTQLDKRERLLEKNEKLLKPYKEIYIEYNKHRNSLLQNEIDHEKFFQSKHLSCLTQNYAMTNLTKESADLNKRVNWCISNLNSMIEEEKTFIQGSVEVALKQQEEIDKEYKKYSRVGCSDNDY
ncbi:hypothetical protein DLAC_08765 [Tieghemostelium lacteum]|uniref:Uncharacterized protein n=1 Tax=Tieghemostelium lacteum TaxID=361077 RepID=A0A151Z894_TIELA|nr:hypothetical protein DLAC_08765 [Tieghemostelium lacteum]|eukprot:KYQ90172.1 hypothetical protein DLAC_08765 [Tieghemostelium lacteum]